MAYFHKLNLTVTSASSKSWGTTGALPEQSGYLECVAYEPDASNPLNANSSAVMMLRRGSTAGPIIFRSSSGIAGSTAYYYPRASVCKTTDGGALIGLTSSVTSYVTDKIPIPEDEKLCFIRKEASSSGSTMGGSLISYIGG